MRSCRAGPLGSFLAGQTFSVALRRPQYIVSLYLDTCRFQAKGRRVATEAQPAKQTKLLVVEDDAMIGMLLADMLEQIPVEFTYNLRA